MHGPGHFPPYGPSGLDRLGTKIRYQEFHTKSPQTVQCDKSILHTRVASRLLLDDADLTLGYRRRRNM